MEGLFGTVDNKEENQITFDRVKALFNDCSIIFSLFSPLLERLLGRNFRDMHKTDG